MKRNEEIHKLFFFSHPLTNGVQLEINKLLFDIKKLFYSFAIYYFAAKGTVRFCSRFINKKNSFYYPAVITNIKFH